METAPKTDVIAVGAREVVAVGPTAEGVVRFSDPHLLARPSQASWIQTLDRGGKRALDIAVAGTLLVVLLPIFLLTAALIKLDSPGPLFFRCHRVGRGGRPLAMLKFRKMHHGASGMALTMAGDQRFTRVGRMLALTKLDELPQLWQVVAGDMSLVGPRPEDPEFVEHHSEDYDTILTVRPGITGLSQIAFAEEGRILDEADPVNHYLGRLLPQKVGLDQLYAQRRSIVMDLRILLWTAAAVLLRRQVAVHRETSSMNLRRR